MAQEKKINITKLIFQGLLADVGIAYEKDLIDFVRDQAGIEVETIAGSNTLDQLQGIKEYIKNLGSDYNHIVLTLDDDGKLDQPRYKEYKVAPHDRIRRKGFSGFF